MTWLIASLASAAWGTGWWVTGRRLYFAWRPGRVALCGKTEHTHRTGCRNTNGNVPGYYTCGKGDHEHRDKCYRRRRADLSLVKIDSDREAAACALLVTALWPFALGGWLFMRNPPELPEEKRARLAKLAKDSKQLERDNGIR